MRITLKMIVLSIALGAAAAIRAGAGPAAPATPTMFAEQIVFLYYTDLQPAEAFFGGTLGFAKTMDAEWVKIYRTAGGAFVGAVKEGRGYHKTSSSKPVMVTWVVEDVDAWYARVRKAGVKVLREPRSSTDPPARTFLVADSTGYTFEFMQWLKR
jgi:predicted enzyme related to lactoylglutathione lyase